MKHLNLFPLMSLLLIGNAFAESCLERLHNPNWPEDKLEKVYNCKLNNISLGSERLSYGDSICFGITKTQLSDYKTTSYSVLRFTEGEVGSLIDIVSVDARGRVYDKDSSIEIADEVIAMTNKHYSFSQGEKWLNESVIDLNSSKLTFNQYDIGFLRRTKKFSAEYDCEIEL